ncbi:MAG: vWA domain-containing protein [Puniceicoccales bacterium]
MNNNLTEIAFILDRSGSMAAMQDIAVEGFNKFLADQQADEQEVRLSLVLFDHAYDPLYQSLPVSEIIPLSMDDFRPRGTTALLDAMGKTIDSLGKRLANTPEAERPGHVIVATMTDGMENASERYNPTQVHKMITHQQEKYDWEFLFLSSDLNALDMAKNIGISQEHQVLYSPTPEGNREAHNASIQYVREMKKARRRRGS